MAKIELNEKEIDILIEVANIGTGNASKSLSVLSGCHLVPLKPEVLVVSLKDATELLGDGDEKIVYGDVDLSGSIEGKSVFIFPSEHADRLVEAVTKKAGIKIQNATESGLKEIFNIFTGHYLSALANLLNIKLMHSLPMLFVEPKEQVLQVLFKDVESVICIRTVIDIKEFNIFGYFLLVMDHPNTMKLIDYINQAL